MTGEEKKSNFRWLVLVLVFLNMFIVFLAVQSIPPLFTEIGEQIPLTKAQMGIIMGMITIPSLFFSPIGGAITDKIGSRWAFGVSVLIIAIAGALRSTMGSAYGLAACMALMGVGLSTMAPNLPKALGMWFPPNEFAMANGICMVSMPMASAVGMGTAAGFLSPYLGGWRNVMLVAGIITLITGLLWIVLFRDIKLNKTSDKKQSIIENFKTVFKIKDVWWASAFFALGNAGIMSLYTLLPHSLSERGITEAKAGAFVAIMMVTNAIFKIVGGTASDKTGRRKPFLFIGNIIIGLCVITFTDLTGIPLVIALIIGGAAVGCISPIFMVTLVEMKGIGTALAGTTMGLIFMIGNGFGFVGPVVSGKLMDLTGSQFPGFLFMAFVFIASALCILPVKETGQGKTKKPIDQYIVEQTEKP